MSSIHWPAVNFTHIIKFILSVSRADTNTSQQALKGRRNHFAAEKLFTNVSAKYDLVGLNDIFYTWASTKTTVLFVFRRQCVEVNV